MTSLSHSVCGADAVATLRHTRQVGELRASDAN